MSDILPLEMISKCSDAAAEKFGRKCMKGFIQKPNMIVINIATFIRNRGKIRQQLDGVDFYNSFSNNNEIWEGYFIQSSYLTQFNIFNAISLLPKACQKP